MKIKVEDKKKIAVSGIGAGVNLLLFLTKLYIGISVNSIAVYADAINSLADCIVCIIAVIGFCFISSKPIEKYPFGTGRYEDILSLVISAVIVATGGAFAFISIERLMYPVPVWYSSTYAAVIGMTAAAKLGLFAFFVYFSKKEKSLAVKGMAADSLLDFFITLCALISFSLTQKLTFSVDGFAGMLISIILLVQGIRMTVNICGKIAGKRNVSVCNRAKKIIEEYGVNCESIECHIYGDKKVFTAVIASGEYDIQSVSKMLEVKLNEKIPSELYLKFGGNDEK